MRKHANLLTLLIVVGLVLGCLFGQFILFDVDGTLAVPAQKAHPDSIGAANPQT